MTAINTITTMINATNTITATNAITTTTIGGADAYHVQKDRKDCLMFGLGVITKGDNHVQSNR